MTCWGPVTFFLPLLFENRFCGTQKSQILNVGAQVVYRLPPLPPTSSTFGYMYIICIYAYTFGDGLVGLGGMSESDLEAYQV